MTQMSKQTILQRDFCPWGKFDEVNSALIILFSLNNKSNEIHNSNILGLTLRVEFFNPFAVCIILEGFHGLEGVKQESGEELGP